MAGAPPSVYYFEATRRTKRDAAYGISIRGWIRQGAAGGWTAVGVDGRVLAEDSGLVPMMTPLGVFRLSGRVYWVARVTGYEDTTFAIYDTTPTVPRAVITADAGGC